jgi:hypothetical protein
MARRRLPIRHNGIALAVLVMLSACASKPVQPQHPAPPVVDYDWHPLIIMPFGTRLVDSPFRVHELVLFDAAADEDCFALDGGVPPHFAGRPAQDYRLCFEHDRLKRIEATVNLPAQQAEAEFAALCADWAKRGSSGKNAGGERAGGDNTAGGSTAGECAGGDDAARVLGQLAPSGSDPANAVLTLRLTGLAR